MLPTKIGDNLGFLEKIVLTSKLDCDEMVDCCKAVGMRFGGGGESRLGS